MEFTLTGTGEGVLILTGSLSIERAEEMKAALTAALGQADRVTIQVEGDPDVHLACLQLLCAAHRTAAQGKKSLVLRSSSEIFRKTVRGLGLGRQAGCLPGDPGSCLWNEEAGK